MSKEPPQPAIPDRDIKPGSPIAERVLQSALNLFFDPLETLHHGEINYILPDGAKLGGYNMRAHEDIEEAFEQSQVPLYGRNPILAFLDTGAMRVGFCAYAFAELSRVPTRRQLDVFCVCLMETSPNRIYSDVWRLEGAPLRTWESKERAEIPKGSIDIPNIDVLGPKRACGLFRRAMNTLHEPTEVTP